MFTEALPFKTVEGLAKQLLVNVGVGWGWRRSGGHVNAERLKPLQTEVNNWLVCPWLSGSQGLGC